MSRNFVRLSTVVLCAASPLASSLASAQQGANESIEEIVVVGTRRLNRTVANSPVPVDVFKGADFENMGNSDMDDMLRTLVPSYNVERYPLNDESSLVRPATLRGLPADNTLILVNGKRRHRSAVIASSVGGSQGPDMSVLPAIAVQRVEVLRDGASAQYGSDAIAGVINYVLRENSEGITAEFRTGEFYAGDGRSRQFGFNIGLPLTEAGFVNLSLEYGDREATSRSEQRSDALALENLGAPGIPNPAQNYGQPLIDDEIKFFVNAAMNVGENSELYAFANVADRTVVSEFFWRNQNNFGNIYTSGPDRLVFDLTADDSGNCPLAGSANAIPHPNWFFPTQAEYDADLVALAALEADPDCWVVNEIYPNGYRPNFGAEIVDWSTVIGYRGERDSGFRYDASASYGVSDVKYLISNTLNASLGPSSPTSFQPGGAVQTATSVNFDMAWPVELGIFYSTLNIAAGVEWREESFETVAGGEASWSVGPLHLQGASIGTNGYPGYPPEQAGTWTRANTAIYLDLEADVTEKLLLGLAVRFEDFEDFGSTTNYKGTFRYSFNDVIAIRASASTGFRAPTPGQSNLTRTTTTGFNDELVQGGQIPPTNPIALFYGGAALTPEEAENLSVGFSLQPLDNLTVTVDFFRIDLQDRISIGPNQALSAQDIADLIALGVPGASDFRFVNFFGNGMDTRTEGVDIVASYNIDWETGGDTDLTLAWNNTKTRVVSVENPSRRSIVSLEGRPRNRGILTANHSWNNVRFLARASYYDSWVAAEFNVESFEPICTDERPNPPGTDECYASTWMIDVEAAYTFNERYTIVAGADNVFDKYPETDYDYPDFSFGVVYPRASPLGYHGGFWYLRLRAEF